MNCTEVKELLSAFYDAELSAEIHAEVAEHVDGCRDCARELEAFRNLSALAEGLTQPQPPARLWRQIEEKMDAGHGLKPVRPALLDGINRARSPRARIGMAAAAAIIIAAAWLGYRAWFEHTAHRQFTAVFGQYVEQLRRDPHAAQHILLANYEGQAVDVAQAVQTVGYRPAAVDGVPEGYSLDSTYVMKMPCCTCVQCLCKRRDGTTIAIFEHDDEETKRWFGDRPEVAADCNGVPCRLVQLDGGLAASWKRGKRHMTVIGMRDTAEISELVAWFDRRKHVESK